MNRRRWWIGTCLVLTLLSAACADTGTGIEPDLNEVYLDGLLFGFSPVYNYTSQPTRILGHIARVTPRELRPWQRSMGFNDRDESREINQSSLFRIASVTKMFTATVVLQLWEEGLVDLDAPFNDYLELDEVTHPKIPLFADFSGFCGNRPPGSTFNGLSIEDIDPRSGATFHNYLTDLAREDREHRAGVVEPIE